MVGGILHCARQCSGWLCSGRGHALRGDSVLRGVTHWEGQCSGRGHALGGTVPWEGSRIGRDSAVGGVTH